MTIKYAQSTMLAIHILFYNFVNNGTFCVISDAVIMALLAETKVQGIQIRE